MKSGYPKLVFAPLFEVGAYVHSRAEELFYVLAPVVASVVIVGAIVAGVVAWWLVR